MRPGLQPRRPPPRRRLRSRRPLARVFVWACSAARSLARGSPAPGRSLVVRRLEIPGLLRAGRLIGAGSPHPTAATDRAYNVMTLFGRWYGCGDLAGAEGFRRAQQPLEQLPELLGRDSAPRPVQIGSHIVHRAGQDVELIMQSIQLGPSDHEFTLRQLEFARALPGHPIPLPASRGAELARTTGATSLRQGPPTPPASPRLVHGLILS